MIRFQKNHQVVESAKALWQAFERDFDPARFESMARKFRSGAPLPVGWQLLGEGADQTAIGLNGKPYALLMPKEGFLKSQGDDGRRWLASLRRLGREARTRLVSSGVLTLVPPMAVTANPPGIIMVQGVSKSGARAPEEVVENTRLLLRDLRLELGDGQQLMVVEDCWFIHDWSGLSPTSSAVQHQVLESSINF